jgi:hypothetical protein
MTTEHPEHLSVWKTYIKQKHSGLAGTFCIAATCHPSQDNTTSTSTTSLHNILSWATHLIHQQAAHFQVLLS